MGGGGGHYTPPPPCFSTTTCDKRPANRRWGTSSRCITCSTPSECQRREQVRGAPQWIQHPYSGRITGDGKSAPTANCRSFKSSTRGNNYKCHFVTGHFAPRAEFWSSDYINTGGVWQAAREAPPVVVQFDFTEHSSSSSTTLTTNVLGNRWPCWK